MYPPRHTRCSLDTHPKPAVLIAQPGRATIDRSTGELASSPRQGELDTRQKGRYEDTSDTRVDAGTWNRRRSGADLGVRGAEPGRAERDRQGRGQEAFHRLLRQSQE